MSELGSRGRSIRRVSTPPRFFLKLRPRDMATFGQLFLQNGQWNGRQVVPTAWVRQATTAQAGKAFPDYGGSAPGSAFNPTNYGYFWWVEPTTGVAAYYAWGFGGQLVEVVPSLHLVIVVSSNVDETRPAQRSVPTRCSTWSTRSCQSSRPIRLAELSSPSTRVLLHGGCDRYRDRRSVYRRATKYEACNTGA